MSLDEPTLPRRVVRLVRERTARGPDPLGIVVFVTAGVVASELLLFSGRTWPAIWGHFLTLLFCTGLLHRGNDTTLVQTFMLVPLFRLVNLGMPVFFQLTAYWFPLIYGPLVPALVLVDRTNPDMDVSFGLRRALLLLPVALPMGAALAEVESAILESAALIPTWSLGQLLMISVVMVCFVGFVEEYLFRALLQPALQDAYGRWPGILFASAIFGLMHSGYGIPAEMLFAGVIGFVFGVCYEYLDSLVFISIVHGVLNVFLFAVLPIKGSMVSF